MNPIRTIRSLAYMLTGLAAALAAAVMVAPAAFAATRVYPPPQPPPGVLSRYEPVLVPHTVPAHTHAAVTGGLAGWQITLIAVGVAILAAIVAVLLHRARAARSHRPATAG
jgi:anti-sigma-K factor RskA